MFDKIDSTHVALPDNPTAPFCKEKAQKSPEVVFKKVYTIIVWKSVP
jgi:hypothetical protein